MKIHIKLLFPALMLAAWMLSSCSKPGPEPISYGKDSCAYCAMIASEPNFGAELITPKGKMLKFDSVECMARYVSKNRDKAGSLFVVDYDTPSRLIDATRASYLVSEKLPSPMGMNLSAFESRGAATAMQGKVSGSIHSWSEVLALVSQ